MSQLLPLLQSVTETNLHPKLSSSQFPSVLGLALHHPDDKLQGMIHGTKEVCSGEVMPFLLGASPWCSGGFVVLSAWAAFPDTTAALGKWLEVGQIL